MDQTEEPRQVHPASGHALSPGASVYTTIALIAAIAAFVIPYHSLATRVDRQLAEGAFRNSFTYYTGREVLSLGDPVSEMDVAAALKRANCPVRFGDHAIIVESREPVEIQFAGGQITGITNLNSRMRFNQYELPPQMMTNISDEGRARALMVRYSDLPPVLIRAIVAAEDKHFFTHSGLDPLRIAKASYVDVREHRKEQGASTISMQLARCLWLERNKAWTRKFSEMLITLHLERKLSKQQILEDYANAVYLGGQGSFSINGFGEAARVFFNKDVHNLNLTEAAALAGIVQRPSYYNPLKYPGRVLDRRNIVLALMREDGYLTPYQYQEAIQMPLGLHPGAPTLAEDQYFLDLAGSEAMRDLDQRAPTGSSTVYTTMDPRLQRAAEQAVASGMSLVDQQLAGKARAGHRPQVALIALDPHTGEIKALIGGRDYAVSQLNRVLAKRPPGSVFKPFVYTAALDTALSGGSPIFTEASTVMDEPTTFQFDKVTYTPSNFQNRYFGTVTLRQALAHSLNNATVRLGQMVGFNRVVDLAHRAGMNEDIKPTPAVALGAYQVTPMEIAGAYTIFANGGDRVQPAFISEVRNNRGVELYSHAPNTTHVLDRRIAFLMTDMLQEVMRSGTAAGVRARGFTLPAAGKTGTSHDGWFAGFTSQLLCVVWVGFDDYSELGLEGARSALPIWTDFMMRAARFHQYGDAKAFVPPPGVVAASTTSSDGEYCPGAAGYYLEGTQPVVQCTPSEVNVEFTEDGATERSVPAGRQVERPPDAWPGRLPDRPPDRPQDQRIPDRPPWRPPGQK